VVRIAANEGGFMSGFLFLTFRSDRSLIFFSQNIHISFMSVSRMVSSRKIQNKWLLVGTRRYQTEKAKGYQKMKATAHDKSFEKMKQLLKATAEAQLNSETKKSKLAISN
jgi:hypothetical protein